MATDYPAYHGKCKGCIIWGCPQRVSCVGPHRLEDTPKWQREHAEVRPPPKSEEAEATYTIYDQELFDERGE